jgi:diguanylate cyclase
MIRTHDGSTAPLSHEQQQRLREQALLTEIDLLRRTLVRCSLAIRDSSPAIELCLRDLRQALRGKETLSGLRALLPRLENVLAESEYLRASRMSRELVALSAQVARLEGQALPVSLREATGEFARNLSGVLPQQVELVVLHKAFADLQWQALEHTVTQRNPAAGLLKRLLGGQEAVPVAADEGAKTLIDGFSQVLRALLSQSALPMKYQIQLRRLLGRLHGEVETDALVSLIDGLGELVLEAGEDQLQLLDFLSRLNERLSHVQAGLEALGAERAEGSALAEGLDHSLRRQVGDMQATVVCAVDLDSLKQSISCRLEALLDGLEEQRSQREVRDQALTGSLQQLSTRIMELEREAEVCRDQLNEQRREALRDPLTGLANRTAWNSEVQQALERRSHQSEPLALAVLDVDHFKQVNDRFGHLAGDKVLKLIADIIQRRMPPATFLARYGGEEFVLLLPGYDLPGARPLIEELLASIQSCPFHFKGERLPVTLSAGLACFGPDEEVADEVFERADQALYRAKQLGRNRLVVDGLAER